MARAENQDVGLYFEDSGGAGSPVLFLHEYAGDHRSWAGQTKALSGSHRCLTASARGYPPSDCPDRPDAYTQDTINGDALAVLDAAGVDKAHIVGLSMGAFTALQLAQFFPERVLSVTAAAGGSGSAELPLAREGFVTEALGLAGMMEKIQRGARRGHVQGTDPHTVALEGCRGLAAQSGPFVVASLATGSPYAARRAGGVGRHCVSRKTPCEAFQCRCISWWVMRIPLACTLNIWPQADHGHARDFPFFRLQATR